MARVKRYLDIDVVQAAEDRLRHVYETFDTVCVAFSGGKDSLVTLELAHKIGVEYGHDKVITIFRDEELIPDSVVDFVNEYRQKDWVDMRWFCVPMRSHKYILGITKEYIQWDRNRRHVREIPPWAITLPPGDDRILEQYTMDTFVTEGLKGRIAILNGIRASESLIRFRSAVNKLNENYINEVTVGPGYRKPANIRLVKPLYDWEENDIFKWLGENGIRYCPVYDAQLWSGAQLRVSTPLHAENAKRLDRLKAFAPGLFEQVIDVFPEVRVQERYYRDYDMRKIVAKFGRSLETVADWVEQSLEGRELELARQRIKSLQTRVRLRPQSYPPDYLLKQFMSGAFKREILPLAEGK